MAAHVRTVEVPDADRRELERRGPGQGRAGPEGRTRPDRAALGRWSAGQADRSCRRVRRANGGHLARSVCRMRPGRPGGPAPTGQAGAAARAIAGSGAGADADRAAEPVRRHALVLPVAGCGPGRRGEPDRAHHRRPWWSTTSPRTNTRRAGLARTPSAGATALHANLGV